MTQLNKLRTSGLKADYQPEGIHHNTLYFVTDTKEILYNGLDYGRDLGLIQQVDTVLGDYVKNYLTLRGRFANYYINDNGDIAAKTDTSNYSFILNGQTYTFDTQDFEIVFDAPITLQDKAFMGWGIFGEGGALFEYLILPKCTVPNNITWFIGWQPFLYYLDVSNIDISQCTRLSVLDGGYGNPTNVPTATTYIVGADKLDWSNFEGRPITQWNNQYTPESVFLPKMKDASSFFSDYSGTVDMNSINFAKVENLNGLFTRASGTFNFITKASLTFRNTGETEQVWKIPTGVTSMEEWFFNFRGTLNGIEKVNTSQITNMRCTYGAYDKENGTIDASWIDCANCTDITRMFAESNVATINAGMKNMNKITTCDNLFRAFDQYNTVHKTYLTTINFGSNFNLSTVTQGNPTTIFENQNKLTTVTGTFKWTPNFDLNLSMCPLTAESAMVFINGLPEITTTHMLKLKATTYDALSEEQISIGTSKGWNIAKQ